MENKFSAKDGLKAFFIGFISYFVIQLVGVIIVLATGSQESYTLTIILSACIELGFLIPLFFIGKGKKLSTCLHIDKKINIKNLVLSIIAIFITFIAFLLFNNLMTFILSKIGYNTSLGPSPKLETFGQLILSLIFVALCPAVCEEVLFRGIICNSFTEKSKKFAIIFSSLFFMFIHMNLNQSLYPLTLGLLFSCVLIFTDSLWYTIIGHFLNNATVLVLGYIIGTQESTALEYSSFSSVILSILPLVIAIIIDILIIRYLRKTNKQSENNIKTTSENKDVRQIIEEKSFSISFTVTMVLISLVYVLSVISGFLS